MLKVKVFRWRRFKIRSIVTWCRSVCTMIGIRELVHTTPEDVFNSLCRDTLMEECVRAMQQSLREAVPVKKRVKSVYNQRNLGTIKERKKEKQEKEVSSGEAIMRILRMRCVPVPLMKRFFVHSGAADRIHKNSLRSSLTSCKPCERSKSDLKLFSGRGSHSVFDKDRFHPFLRYPRMTDSSSLCHFLASYTQVFGPLRPIRRLNATGSVARCLGTLYLQLVIEYISLL
jgi:hypothetical protein